MNIEDLRKYVAECDMIERRIKGINKNINETKYTIANTADEGENKNILTRRLEMMKKEKKVLVDSIIELRDFMGKATFSDDYTQTIDRREFNAAPASLKSNMVAVENPKKEEVKEESKEVLLLEKNDEIDYSKLINKEEDKIGYTKYIKENLDRFTKPLQPKEEIKNEKTSEVNFILVDNKKKELVPDNVNFLRKKEKQVETIEENNKKLVSIEKSKPRKVTKISKVIVDEAIKNEENKVRGLRVICNGDKYKFYVNLDEDVEIYETNTAKRYLRNKELVKKVAKKYNIDKKKMKNIDINLFFGLMEIDEDFDTRFSDDYIIGQLDANITYNNEKMMKSKKLRLNEKIKQYFISLRQKEFANANIIHTKALVVPAAMLITLALIPAAYATKKGSNKQKNTQYRSAVTTEANITEELANEQDIVDEILTKKAKKKNKETENDGFKVGDRIQLVSKDTSGNIVSSYEIIKNINNKKDIKDASSFDCDYFKVSEIYAELNGKKVDTVTALSNMDYTTNELYRKHGPKVDLYLNFDGYNEKNDKKVYESIGYINTDSITHFDNKTKKLIAKTKSKLENTEDYNSNNKKVDSINIGINDELELTTEDYEHSTKKTLLLNEDAWGNGKTVSANDINCDYFKVSYIAAYRGNEVLATIKTNSKDAALKTKDLYEKFGDDIDIAFNFDGYKKEENGNDKRKYKYLGWVNINEVAQFKTTNPSKNKKTIKEMNKQKVKQMG